MYLCRKIIMVMTTKAESGMALRILQQ